MNILLIEDMAGFAIPIKEELQAQGHIVTWFVGAERVDADYLIGITASPALKELETDTWKGESERLVTVPFAGIDVALVDGGLIGPVRYGMDFARALSAFGIACVSITGGGAGAAPMAEAGCCAALPKEFVLTAVGSGLLDFDELRQNPTGVAEKLACFSATERERLLKAA